LAALALSACGGTQPLAVEPISPYGPMNYGTVLVGDSLSYNWSGESSAVPLATTIYDLIPQPFIDAGISGNTSCAMWARFEADVMSYAPLAVIIWAGTNDVRTGLTSVACVKDMAQTAAQAGARVLILTIPPSPALDQNAIAAWNDALAALAADYHYVLVDDASALAPGGAANFIGDGVHLNQTGYDLVWSVLSYSILG
jgi:lysophospholipase L1-like esterase